ncbi:MAG: glycosyltransferase [Oscillospiraceae bacterium]|nr:glycosyltransferase [Oscillospiraceae bacterium]
MNVSTSTWDEVAKGYTTTIDGSERELADSILAVLKKNGIRPNSKLLELGCGSGHLSACLNMAGYSTHMLDFSHEALSKARQTFETLGLCGEFIHGDILNMEALQDNDYDLVWNSGVMEHFADDTILEAFDNLKKVSKRMFVLVPNPDSVSYLLMRYVRQAQKNWPYGKEYLRSDYVEVINAAGFDKVSSYYMGKSWTSHNFKMAMGDAKYVDAYTDMVAKGLMPEREQYLIGYFASTEEDIPVSVESESDSIHSKSILEDIEAQGRDLLRSNFLRSAATRNAEVLTEISDLNAERFGLELSLHELSQEFEKEAGRVAWYAAELALKEKILIETQEAHEQELRHLEDEHASIELRHQQEKSIIEYEMASMSAFMHQEISSLEEKYENLIRQQEKEAGQALAAAKRSEERLSESLEKSNQIIAEALAKANDLFETRLFKVLHFLKRTGNQFIKGKWAEKKNYLKWLSSHIRRKHYIDRGYNPIHAITDVLDAAARESVHGEHISGEDVRKDATESGHSGLMRPAVGDASGYERILYVYQWATMGGVERVFLNRARAFKQHGLKIRVDIYFFHDSGGLDNFKQYIKYFGLEDYLSVVRNIDERVYSRIFTFDTPEVFAIVKDTSKVIVECHTPYKKMREYLKSMPVDIAGLVAPGEAFLNLIIKEVPKSLHNKLFILPNFYFENVACVTPSKIWDKTPIFYFGRMDSLKNTKEILEMFRSLKRERGDDYILVLAGTVIKDDLDLAKVAKALAIEDRLTYLPPVPFEKVDELLYTIKAHRGIFISSSTGESFGLSALEAMGSGVPVMLSDIKCHEALVDNDPDFLYESGALDAAVSKIGMIEQNYDEFSGKVKLYSQKFNSANFITSWKALMKQQFKEV